MTNPFDLVLPKEIKPETRLLFHGVFIGMLIGCNLTMLFFSLLNLIFRTLSTP